MSSILLKSYIGECFLSFSILLQLIVNIRVINNKKYVFPEINKETFVQSLFILFIVFILVQKSLIEGSFYGSLLINDSGTKTLKIVFLMTSIFALPVLSSSFNFHKLSFFEYYNLLLISILALLLMISSGNLLSFYILMEMQALCYYILASFKRNSAFSIEAGLKYFISGSFISGFFLLGSSLIYGLLGTLNLNEIMLLVSIPLEEYNAFFLIVCQIGLFFILSTLLFKIACFPFHFWAPDVYEGAPLTSTIVFSLFPKIALFSFFVKIIDTFLVINSSFSFGFLDLLLNFGSISVIYGSLLALNQTRVKKLIIYSSIAQTGFMVASLSIGNLNGFTSTFFFLLVYIMTSILIWGYISYFYENASVSSKFFNLEVKTLYLSSLENLYKYNSLICFPLVIALFSIAGIPPFAGFLVKAMVLNVLIQSDSLYYAILLLFVSAVSVYYYIRILKVVYFEPKKNSSSNFFFFQRSNSNNFSLMVSISTIGLIYFFFFPSSILLVSQYINLL